MIGWKCIYRAGENRFSTVVIIIIITIEHKSDDEI